MDRENAPLPCIAGEEDPRLDLEHLFKVEDGITLEISVVDEELVDVAAVDGAVDVKLLEHRHSRNLAYNATIVANMDIMLVNVLKELSGSGSSGIAQSVNQRSNFAQARGGS